MYIGHACHGNAYVFCGLVCFALAMHIIHKIYHSMMDFSVDYPTLKKSIQKKLSFILFFYFYFLILIL